MVRDAHKLSPTRVCTTMEQLDSIDEAVVVAIEDEGSGQLPVAVVTGVETGEQNPTERVQRHVGKTFGQGVSAG